MSKLLLLTSGGDAPGMNAAIRACVRTAIYHGIEVYGCQLGFQGLIDGLVRPLKTDDVANCIQRGGTLLKTARCPTFIEKDIQQKCRDYLKEHAFSGLIILGGNGSFQGAVQLATDNQLQVIGVPCTIDNDINGTEYCIGFDTACNTALNAIDRIRDTALSHERNFIIEVMGRKSGFIALEVGTAGGAEFIITPEFPIEASTLVKKIQNKRREKLTSIIVAAEANNPSHSLELAQTIRSLSGLTYQTCILGHIQRGGAPTAMDRVCATKMGALAIQAIQQGRSHEMVAKINGKICLTSLPDPKTPTRFLQDEDLLKLNQIVCGIE